MENFLEDVIYMKTFGSFSLTWNGISLIGNGKSSESHYSHLLRLLLHYREGVSREELEESLFGEKNLDNVHHMLQSVIYNAKQKLRQLGLPNVNYIVKENGIYKWTDSLPVVEDASLMERFYKEAEAQEDLTRREELYWQVIFYYEGEFMPSLTGVIWAALEAKKYRAIFCDSMEKIVPLLRAHGKYDKMEEIGSYASRVQPLANWEVVAMEACVAQGKLEEAEKLYYSTIDYYLREQGLQPSQKLMEQFRKLGGQVEHSYARIDDIQEALTGYGRDNETGGYICPYPVFQEIYRLLERMIERGGQSVFLMLCTIVDGKGNPMEEGTLLEDLSERLESSIRCSVRRTDVLSRYNKGQYLVLLINTTRENCSVVQRRINQHFLIRRQRRGIQYYVNSVICTPY